MHTEFTFYSCNKTYRNYLNILLSEKCLFLVINLKKLLQAALTIFSRRTLYLLIKKIPSKSTIRRMTAKHGIKASHLSISVCNSTFFFLTVSVFGSDKNASNCWSLVLLGRKLMIHSYLLLWTIHVY